MSDEITEFPTKLHTLPHEDRVAKHAAIQARKAFATVYSPFVKAMQECMAGYHQARANGLERDDAAKGIELAIRDLWTRPTTKFGPACQACEDTGYEEHVCRPYKRCERATCHTKGDEWQHWYVTPCACVKGLRFAPKIVTAETAAAGVGKVSRPKKGFSRFAP